MIRESGCFLLIVLLIWFLAALYGSFIFLTSVGGMNPYMAGFIIVLLIITTWLLGEA